MSTLAERLREVLRTPGAARPADTPTRDAPTDAQEVAEQLGGEWSDARGDRYLVVDTSYSPGYRHGRVALGDRLPSADGMWRGLPLLEPAAAAGRLLFVDLETTGLAGGAGTYAFLVGCGWFEGGGFRVRQFFLASHAAERAMLQRVAEVAATSAVVVTYNGKSFDLPLIETRFLFHRLATPFAALPHVDMLHTARRLWRDATTEGCRLASIEAALLGHVREGDVPGFEIPSRYFHYVRTSDTRPLRGVLEHNRLDLLTVAMVTVRADQLLDEGVSAVATAREALGLGLLYERRGRPREAKACYTSAFDDPRVGAEALRAYALLCRRERQYAAAATAWKRLLDLRDCPPQIAREAAEALAIHLEHRERNLCGAREYAVQSLRFKTSRSQAQAVHHRLARLGRKIGSSSVDARPLF